MHSELPVSVSDKLRYRDAIRKIILVVSGRYFGHFTDDILCLLTENVPIFGASQVVFSFPFTEK